jgi:hypothetical protein
MKHEEYSKGFSVSGDIEDDWLLDAIRASTLRLHKAMMHSFRHGQEGTECSPACPDYEPPMPIDSGPPCTCECECDRCNDENDW